MMWDRHRKAYKKARFRKRFERLKRRRIKEIGRLTIFDLHEIRAH